MAWIQKSLPCESATLANFNAWGKGLHDALISLGWANTADTGQVNWSTNVAVPSSGAFGFYEVFVSQDTLSATNPIYLRFDYGRSTGTPGGPLITVQSGIPNGAGTLIGGTTVGMPIAEGAAGSTSLYECHFAGTSGTRLAILMFRNLGASQQMLGWFFAIERSMDSSGNYTDSYVTMLYNQGQATGNGGTKPTQQTGWKPKGGGWNPIINGGVVCAAVQAANNGYGNHAPFCPIHPLVGKLDNPMTVAGVMKNADMLEGGVFPVRLYGNVCNFLYTYGATGGASNIGKHNQFGYPGVTNSGVCMRID